MAARRSVRNLTKIYTISFKNVRGDYDAVYEHGRLQKHRVAKDEQGNVFLPDQRRMNPSIAGRLGKEKSITGTAAELYINHGVDARGLGGSGRRRSKH